MFGKYLERKKRRIYMSMLYICNLPEMIGGKETITSMNQCCFSIEFTLKINKLLLIQNSYLS